MKFIKDDLVFNTKLENSPTMRITEWTMFDHQMYNDIVFYKCQDGDGYVTYNSYQVEWFDKNWAFHQVYFPETELKKVVE